MSPHLVNFYKTWLHWATHEDAENPVGFTAERGLCSGLWRYCNWLGLDTRTHEELLIDMLEQFKDHELNTNIPFNMDGAEYWDEPDKRKNAARLQWCIDRIAEAEGHD